jgi:transposase-like protein
MAEMALERGLVIHSNCIWRWVQIYGPELDKRCCAHLKCTNKSYRVDETYIRIKGQKRYLYRAVDSTGQTIDFLLTAKRDAAAAKRFFRKALLDPADPQPRVINVDQNRVYPAAVEELKVGGTLRRRCRVRQCKYLNNVVEQDHRVSKKRVWLAKGIPIVFDCVADVIGNRGGPHDSEGASQVGGQRRPTRAIAVYRRAVWAGDLTLATLAQGRRSRILEFSQRYPPVAPPTGGRQRWIYGFHLDGGPSLEQVIAEACDSSEADEEGCEYP